MMLNGQDEPGSYNCTCLPHYTGDGVHCYEDRNATIKLFAPTSSGWDLRVGTPRTTGCPFARIPPLLALVDDLCRRAQASLLRAELLEDISHALGIPTSALAMISVKESPAVATAAFQVLMVVERPPAALCEELLEVIVAAAESGAGAAIIGAPAATLLLWSSPSCSHLDRRSAIDLGRDPSFGL